MDRITLPNKPGAEIAYTLSSIPSTRSSPAKPRLIIFLNNLLMPASSWEPTITILNTKRLHHSPSAPQTGPQIQIITYDRFRQGATTSPDPLDSRPTAEPGYGHDFLDVVQDLHSLIPTVLAHHFPQRPITPHPSLFLVGASIGAPLARLYAQTYPETVEAILLLDSNIANADYSDLWPDPDAPGFDPADVVTDDCTLEQYRRATVALAAAFDGSVKNGEGLDRRNVKELLPFANAPPLVGPDGRPTKVVVVGHDGETFAEEGFMRMGTPKSFTRRWVQSAWDRYNQGLLEIGDTTASPDVINAKGCGHFIQRDDPGFVADMMEKVLGDLGW